MIDPCDDPVGVTSKPLANQEYTITQAAQIYTIPVYDANPAWCAITYSYTIVSSAGSAAVTFDSDALVRKFTFNNVVDLTLCGATSKEYTIMVTGKSGNVNKK